MPSFPYYLKAASLAADVKGPFRPFEGDLFIGFSADWDAAATGAMKIEVTADPFLAASDPDIGADGLRQLVPDHTDPTGASGKTYGQVDTHCCAGWWRWVYVRASGSGNCNVHVVTK